MSDALLERTLEILQVEADLFANLVEHRQDALEGVQTRSLAFAAEADVFIAREHVRDDEQPLDELLEQIDAFLDGTFTRHGASISGGRSDGNASSCSDLIGPERSEGPYLAPSAQNEAPLPVHAEDSPANPGKQRCSAPSISAPALEDARLGRWGS